MREFPRSWSGAWASGLTVIALASCWGCSAIEFPELPVDAPSERVYVLQGPLHSAIALRGDDGAYVQWGYGDARFMSSSGFAMAAWGACLVPWTAMSSTRAVIARRRLSGTTAHEIATETGMKTFGFDAEATRVSALREKLERCHRVGRVVRGAGSLRTYPKGYSIWWWNCQDAIECWLAQLGARVSATPVRWGSIVPAEPRQG